MSTTKFKFALTAKVHPDGETHLSTNGNWTANSSCLELFLNNQAIAFRRMNFGLMTYQKLDWNKLKRPLKVFLKGFSDSQNSKLVFSVEEIPAETEYKKPMHFQLLWDGEWLNIIAPPSEEIDLYGTDHGAYEHNIVLTPSIHQIFLIQKTVSRTFDKDWLSLRSRSPNQDGACVHKSNFKTTVF